MDLSFPPEKAAAPVPAPANRALKLLLVVSSLFVVSIFFSAFLWHNVTGYAESYNNSPRLNNPWGSTQQQLTPSMSLYNPNRPEFPAGDEWIPISQSTTNVRLTTANGWGDTQRSFQYRVNFDGTYTFHNPHDVPVWGAIHLPLPAGNGTYEDYEIFVNGEPKEITNWQNDVKRIVQLPPAGDVELKVLYRTRGIDRWAYRFDQSSNGIWHSAMQNFNLHLVTDFDDLQIANPNLPPTFRRHLQQGWEVDWKYGAIVSGDEIAIVMNEPRNSDLLAASIIEYAPVSLLFLAISLIAGLSKRNLDLHPMHYAFLGAGFLSFYVLLSLLIHHLSLSAAFGISAAVSTFLVSGYLRQAVGARFALVNSNGILAIHWSLLAMPIAYPGTFDLAFACCGVLTLFILMQTTARIDWTFSNPNASDTLAKCEPTYSIYS